MSERVEVVTPVGRLSYPHLFTPQPPMNPGDESKYSAAIIFDESADLAELQKAVVTVAVAKWGKDGFQKLRKSGKFTNPLRTDAEDKGYPEGSTFFNARTKYQPQVVSRYKDPETGNMRAITDENEIYPGCDVKLHVTAFAYDVAGNKGVTFGLNAVLKYDDNERLDGRRSAAAVFGGDAVEPEEADLSDMAGPEVESSEEDELAAFM